MKTLSIFGYASIALTACGQLASQTPHPDDSKKSTGQLDSIGAVSWNAKLSNAFFLKGAQVDECYLYIQLKGNDVKQDQKRIPLNISLVLDRSGSMSGEKIAYARRAANFVIDQLGGEDYVSLVSYDDRIELMSESMPVKNKEVLKKKIDQLTDRGSTNMTGGMLEGYAQVKTTKKDGYVNRVLLLTDGLANAGITEPKAIKEIVQKRYSEEGIALSTFGLGLDYNEDLLTALAETGRANYYFIDSADKIPAIFASELKGLLSVVAQNAMVKISVPSGYECQKVFGYPYEVKNNEVSIRLNDVYSKDERGILLKFKSKTTQLEGASFTASLRYTDATTYNEVNDSRKLAFQLTDDKALIEKNSDAEVQEMIALFHSTEEFDQILTDVDGGNYEGAKQKAEASIRILREKQKTMPSEKLRKQEEAIITYSMEIDKVQTMRDDEKKMYQKSNKSANYKTKKGKE